VPKTLTEVRAQFAKGKRSDLDSAICVSWAAALDSVLARPPIDLVGRGCGDHSCRVEPARGMATNGGCRCDHQALSLALSAWRAEATRLTALIDSLDLHI